MQYLLNNDGRSVKTVMDNTRKTYIRKYVDIIELDHNLWVINELGKTHIFLINGARRALLIDTGLGIADLPEIVRRLCGRKLGQSERFRQRAGNIPVRTGFFGSAGQRQNRGRSAGSKGQQQRLPVCTGKQQF